MKYTGKDETRSGVIVPLFSLRTEKSCGIGEFPDLITLGEWCRHTGLEMIQILPVNDTGQQTSPYSALSAFALNPIFIRMQDLPEYNEDDKTVVELTQKLKSCYDALKRVSYHEVLKKKMDILGRLFDMRGYNTVKDPIFLGWCNDNPWVPVYSLFRSLKMSNNEISWVEWSDFNSPDPETILNLWDQALQEGDRDILFFAWIQYRAEQQLQNAAQTLSNMDIFLKGDLPILMNEDSADVWRHREYFNLSLNAGAPPDMFSSEGQNWGFPIYRWDILERNSYSWWKRRLNQADKFYHAFRIDHVLGFFRIWAISVRNVSGRLGFFKPSAYLSRKKLINSGFNSEHISFLSEPHVKEETINSIIDGLTDEQKHTVKSCFQRIRQESLFLFDANIKGEKDIKALNLNKETIDQLLRLYGDRVFIEISDGLYVPAWNGISSSQMSYVSDDMKNLIYELFKEYRIESEKIWGKQGEKLLSFMDSYTGMLICAEDLGDVPEAVPATLEKLNILGLRIPRWTREYEKKEAPFIPVKRYPELSVISPSVHDTSSLREWWAQDEETDKFWYSLGFYDDPPKILDQKSVYKIIKALAEASSLLFLCPIQDFLALDENVRPNEPMEERINVPGTHNQNNWSYRIPVSIESLIENTNLNAKIREICMFRKKGVNCGKRISYS
jgi:4-alpha-glucanotransferase